MAGDGGDAARVLQHGHEDVGAVGRRLRHRRLPQPERQVRRRGDRVRGHRETLVIRCNPRMVIRCNPGMHPCQVIRCNPRMHPLAAAYKALCGDGAKAGCDGEAVACAVMIYNRLTSLAGGYDQFDRWFGQFGPYTNLTGCFWFDQLVVGLNRPTSLVRWFDQFGWLITWFDQLV